METIQTLDDLYVEFMRDLYNAEVLEISESLYFRKKTNSPVLKELIQQHIYHCRSHMQRLEDAMDHLNQSLLEDHCRTMRTMIEEAKRLVDRCSERLIRDMAINYSMQRIGQCKIAAYRTLVSIAEQLDHPAEARQWRNSLDEELDFFSGLKNSMPSPNELQTPQP